MAALTVSLDGSSPAATTDPSPRSAAVGRRCSRGELLLGSGVRLLDHLGPDPIALEPTRVIEADGVTHLRYRVLRA